MNPFLDLEKEAAEEERQKEKAEREASTRDERGQWFSNPSGRVKSGGVVGKYLQQVADAPQKGPAPETRKRPVQTDFSDNIKEMADPKSNLKARKPKLEE